MIAKLFAGYITVGLVFTGMAIGLKSECDGKVYEATYKDAFNAVLLWGPYVIANNAYNFEVDEYVCEGLE